MKCPYCNKKISKQAIAKAMGRSGGKSTQTKHGSGFYSRIGKLGMEKRWGTPSPTK